MPIPNVGELLASHRQIGGNAAEWAVAKAFIVAHQNDYDRVEIEKKLGPGMFLDKSYPAWQRKMAKETYQLRADMVFWRGNIPTIVEAKDRLDGRAIGQLLVYDKLIRQDNPTILQVYKIAIGVSVLNGITFVFEQNGISIELFPSAEAQYGS